jgi:hypothetical protein
VRVGRVVGEDQAVGGPRDHVDADAAEQDALGLGDELVAGADDDIGLGQTEKAEGHGRDTLHAAHGEDLVGAADLGGVDDRRGDADMPGRGGEATAMFRQPATLAVVTVMIAEATWL